MLARIIENWLTSTGELGYQVAFAHLLITEQYRVLHAPVHHPFEHGKDIVAVAPDGGVHAFQLKGGDIGLSDLDKLQGQLFTLAGTAVTYPGIDPPRPPDRAFLVTNGRLTPPARDRIRSFNDGNRQRGFPVIELVECDQLVRRLLDAHGSYMPRELRDMNELLRLVLANGYGPFPVGEFAAMLWRVIAPPDEGRSRTEAKRALASATLLTSYASGSWQRAENHLGLAEAWLVLAFSTLRCAESEDLEEDDWLLSFELARDSARNSLGSLLAEASASQDLVIPDLVDGFVYPARAAIVCGYAAAYFLSERELGNASGLEDPTKRLILRELDYVQAPGEAGTPFLLMMAVALEILNEIAPAVKLVVSWAKNLCVANTASSEAGAPDPYHTVSEVLLHNAGAETELSEEQFSGEAYTLHVAIDWFARRGARPVVEKLWPDVTRLHFCETQPSTPANLLAHDDPEATQFSWAPAAPASWAKLTMAAAVVAEEALPMRLWQHLEVLPYLPLVYPYRLTRDVAKAIDYMTTGRSQTRLLEE